MMEWTYEQEKAINHRGGNLLVSAAAGSGKTAVLIERIIKRVTDPVKPVGVDSLVVVTFTHAAAEEMKTRLGNAFEKLAAKNPGDRHIIKQLSLVDNAKISTIDSFCTFILRNYYNTIDFDPSFRVADAGEIALMKSDVFERIAESRFGDNDREFMDFVESFAPGKGIEKLSEIVFGLYGFAQSNPWPDEWLDECLAMYEVDSADEYGELPIVKDTVEYIRALCEECAAEYDVMICFCDEPMGPLAYRDTAVQERELFAAAARENTLAGLEKALSFKFGSLPQARGVDAEIKEKAKSIRDGIKNRTAQIKEKYLEDAKRQYELFVRCRPHARVITGLVKDFSAAYRAYKTQKSIVDFADIEHYALNILIERKNGKIRYTEIADELAGTFEEIYIDEYQDSNLVQEYILGAVSRERFGEPNTFMVGDVKQSIYKFRMAKPELFMQKYAAYEKDGEKYGKIELHRNFRSRANILDCINDVFYMAMKKNIGGVEYTDEAKLNYCGAFEDKKDDTTEIIIADKAEIDGIAADSAEAYAYMAAHRINELMKEDGNLSYKDIVILLRSDKKTGPVYASVLTNCNIPCVYESSTGYFDSYEVKCIMDLLRIIDNPRQEIPLAGVMRSYFAYFSSQELARIKDGRRKTEFYDCVRLCANGDDETAAKCRDFLAMLSRLRDRSRVCAIRDLISELVYNTGYYDYVGTMGAGKTRCANLDMLVQKAREYEKTSYSGLFNFLRYVEKIQRYDVDYGAARTVSETDDAVRVMSIHKSKGLEFPVVIIGGTAQKYNMRDLSEGLIYDSTFGLGMSYVDLKSRIREEIPYKNMIARRMSADAIGEELRILYVAMTRAVRKLIFLGVTTLDTAKKRWEKAVCLGGLNMAYITENKSFLDIVMPCAMQVGKKGRFSVEYITARQLGEAALSQFGKRVEPFAETVGRLMSKEPDKKAYDTVCNIMDYRYPHSSVLPLHTKYSVSDLKHRAMEENTVPEVSVVPPERIKPVPRFVKKDEAVSPVFFGNAYHKVFELLNYCTADGADSVKTQLDGWVLEGRISKEYQKLIDSRKFGIFLGTKLGASMKKAAENGLLFREQPFAMEVGANEIDPSLPADEKVLVQGIIDAFYFEGDKVFVVDYKTDRVPEGTAGEELLRERYRRQLELYCDAVGRVTGRKIGGCFIYSVCLDKTVSL